MTVALYSPTAMECNTLTNSVSEGLKTNSSNAVGIMVFDLFDVFTQTPSMMTSSHPVGIFPEPLLTR